MKQLKAILALLILGLFSGSAFAQIPGTRIPPRVDDHFQRNMIVSRIDMAEKINQPLVEAEDLSIYSNNGFGETQGLISALMNGLKSGKYLAYDADTLSKSLTFEDVEGVYSQITGNDQGETDPEFEEWDEDVEIEGDNDLEGWEVEEDFEDDLGAAAFNSTQGMDLSAFESVIEIIEARIFDKNRSAIVNDVQYVRLVWVDPGETLPDKNFICFKYSDLLDVMEDTQWKNRFNDAECRNMREALELRMFNSFVINVSGRGVRSLEEADYRRNQLLEFEHNLWSY